MTVTFDFRPSTLFPEYLRPVQTMIRAGKEAIDKTKSFLLRSKIFSIPKIIAGAAATWMIASGCGFIPSLVPIITGSAGLSYLETELSPGEEHIKKLKQQIADVMKPDPNLPDGAISNYLCKDAALFLIAESDHNGALTDADLVGLIKEIRKTQRVFVAFIAGKFEVRKSIQSVLQQLAPRATLKTLILSGHGSKEMIRLNNTLFEVDHFKNPVKEDFEGLNEEAMIILNSCSTSALGLEISLLLPKARVIAPIGPTNFSRFFTDKTGKIHALLKHTEFANGYRDELEFINGKIIENPLTKEILESLKTLATQNGRDEPLIDYISSLLACYAPEQVLPWAKATGHNSLDRLSAHVEILPPPGLFRSPFQ